MVSVTLRAAQSIPLSDNQVDGNFQGLADGVNANIAALAVANATITAQNTTIANLGVIVANLSALSMKSGTTAQRPTPTILGQPYMDMTLGYQINAASLSPVIWNNTAGVPV